MIPNMKYTLAFLLMAAISSVWAQNPSLNIIPRPVSVKQGDGTFKLTDGTTIGYSSTDLANVADMLSKDLSTPTGYTIKTSKTKSAPIQLNLNTTPNTQIGDEGYTLSVTSNGVVISANKPAGVFYGMQTLLQLLPSGIESTSRVSADWSAPVVEITDYPRFKWRGLMLDVSRHFFTKQEVEKYMDDMVRWKFNTFHLHLTDDNGWRIEIKSLPKLTQVGACRVQRYGHFGDREAPQPGEKATDCGFYTQEDIKELVKYAADRFITILPEVDVPGHSMAAIASYPYLSCTQDTSTRVNPGSRFAKWYGNGKFEMLTDNTLDPSSEQVYQFLDKVFTEIAALFPCPYIHVGGDECYKGFWAKDPDCQALMKKLNTDDPEKLQSYFMGRVEKILNSHGKKLIGWDEILEGGLSPGATVMSWRGIQGGIKAAQMGHDVVMSPTTFAYLDYSQGEPTIEPPIYSQLRVSKCYSYEPVPDGVDAKYILGGQANLWTEQVPTMHYAEYMTYPRAWAIAEDFWTPKDLKNYDDFSRRMEATFKRCDDAGINYAVSVYDPMVTATEKDSVLTIHMDTEVSNLDLFYTIDDAMPDQHTAKYTDPIVLPNGPITLRVVAYRNGERIGHLITLSRDQLEKRAKKNDD